MSGDRYEYFTGALGYYEVAMRRTKGWVLEWEALPQSGHAMMHQVSMHRKIGPVCKRKIDLG